MKYKHISRWQLKLNNERMGRGVAFISFTNIK